MRAPEAATTVEAHPFNRSTRASLQNHSPGLLVLLLLLQLQLPLWVSAGAPWEGPQEGTQWVETTAAPSGEASREHANSAVAAEAQPFETRPLSLAATTAAEPEGAVDAETPAEPSILQNSQATTLPQLGPLQARELLFQLLFGSTPLSGAQEAGPWEIQGIIRVVPLQAAPSPAQDSLKQMQQPIYGGPIAVEAPTEASEGKNDSVGPLQRRSERAMQLLLCASLVYAFLLLAQMQKRLYLAFSGGASQQTAPDP